MRLRKIASLIGVSVLAASILLTGCEKKEASNNDSNQAVNEETEDTTKKIKKCDLFWKWENINFTFKFNFSFKFFYIYFSSFFCVFHSWFCC